MKRREGRETEQGRWDKGLRVLERVKKGPRGASGGMGGCGMGYPQVCWQVTAGCGWKCSRRNPQRLVSSYQCSKELQIIKSISMQEGFMFLWKRMGQEAWWPESFVLRTYAVGGMGVKKIRIDWQVKVMPAWGVGHEYLKVLMGFFLWALWALSGFPGLGMKAHFQSFSFPDSRDDSDNF